MHHRDRTRFGPLSTNRPAGNEKPTGLPWVCSSGHTRFRTWDPRRVKAVLYR